MQNILVTGGAGFIGSHFVRQILQQFPDTQVFNIDALTYAGNENIIQDLKKYPQHHFYHQNILDRGALSALFKEVPQGKFDAIIHFAAESHVDRSISNSLPFFETNVLGTQNLLEFAKEFSVPKWIQISTDEVYGSLEKGAAPSRENDALRPRNPYSASKAAADLLCQSYHETYEVPIIITRCVNNYGPNQYPEKLIPVLMQRVKDGKPLPLYGNGTHRRNWIYVEDHCNAIIQILLHGKIGEIYHISGDQECSNLEMAHHVLQAFGHSPETFSSMIQFIEDRPGHDWRYALNDEKTRQLGWKPKMDLTDGLAQILKSQFGS